MKQLKKIAIQENEYSLYTLLRQMAGVSKKRICIACSKKFFIEQDENTSLCPLCCQIARRNRYLTLTAILLSILFFIFLPIYLSFQFTSDRDMDIFEENRMSYEGIQLGPSPYSSQNQPIYGDDKPTSNDKVSIDSSIQNDFVELRERQRQVRESLENIMSNIEFDDGNPDTLKSLEELSNTANEVGLRIDQFYNRLKQRETANQ